MMHHVGYIKSVMLVEIFAFIGAIILAIIAKYIHEKLKESIIKK
jgi:hypothetical protein